MKQSICYKCDNRQEGCHSSCQAYLKERSERDQALKRMADKSVVGDYVATDVQKKRRRWNKKK